MKHALSIIIALILSVAASAQAGKLKQVGKSDYKSSETKIAVSDRKPEAGFLSLTANNSPRFLSIGKFNNDETNIFPARGSGDRADWGLALSGGGIRSASFSIGAMKALFDKGILDEIDVISSVSGGGYASYWLLVNFITSGERLEFGESVFGDERFIPGICKLQERSDFITKKSAVKALLKSKSESFDIYENAILRTFGGVKPQDDEKSEINLEEQTLKSRKISELQPFVKNGAMPYFIFNTTLKTGALGKLGQVIEITPEYIGNPVLGFYKWEGKAQKAWRISEAVATSGAAVKAKWRQVIPNYAKEALKKENLSLSDGGFSENLAALPLIRRGVKNVVIVDAEHDPKYEFGSYLKLQKALRNMGIDFCVEGIENCDMTNCQSVAKDKSKKIAFSPSAVNEGCAKSNSEKLDGVPVQSKIFYIKMSKPAWIFAPGHPLPESFNIGQRTRDDILASGKSLLKERNEKIKLFTPEYDCEKAVGVKFNRDMYFYRVNEYNTYLSGRKTLKYLGKILPDSLAYKFPQIPTIDQNYYADQFEAFVALGYLQTSLLASNP